MAFEPIPFEAPPVNPSPYGLYGATSWPVLDGPPRWIADGVEVRPHNYGGDDAFGVWGAPWCVAEEDLEPEDVKSGERPEFPDPFDAMTVWAYDYCDLTSESQAEVRARVAQNLRLLEQTAAERQFAARLLGDAGSPDTADDIVGAVSHLEGLIAITGTVGLIHASATWAASAAQANLLRYNNGKLVTPLGNQWVFGGGYVGGDGLDDVLVATSPTFGWRTEPVINEVIKHQWNRFAAVAERSVLVGYEALIGAVDITG